MEQLIQEAVGGRNFQHPRIFKELLGMKFG
jgi:hypothetical protein